jgi:hypothetical protein
LPPLTERKISASPVSIRLCSPLSSRCLSVLRSSVRFSLLLTSHRRPPEGTATITRDIKAGEARGLMTIDKCTPSLPLSFPAASSSVFFPRFRLTVSSGAILLSRIYTRYEMFSRTTGTSRVNFLGVPCFVSVSLFLCCCCCSLSLSLSLSLSFSLSLSLSLFISHARARSHFVPPCAREL